MYPIRSSQGDGSDVKPVRTSNRLSRRPTTYGRLAYYSPTTKKKKTKNRTAAHKIAKHFTPGNRPPRTASTITVTTKLRRSTRKRRASVNLDDYTDSSGSQDEDLMGPTHQSSRNGFDNNVGPDELYSKKRRRTLEDKSAPRRQGLRPRQSKVVASDQLKFESGSEQDASEDKVGLGNGNEVDENDADGSQNETEAENEGSGEDEGDDEDEADTEAENEVSREDEGGGEGEGDGDGDDDGEEEGEEDGDDEEGEEEQEGRRRYDLRNRAEVRRLSMDGGKPRPRSPRRVLRQGMGTKVGRDLRKGGSRVHKRHRVPRTEDSDDSLLVDELDQGPAVPWGRGASRSGAPWLFGGLEMPGPSAWGLNVAASGWGHQGDALTTLTSGIQTAGPSSKGGADIQPLQVDESVSFDEIGGLSEYIDSLKEMVFFPLLYPDFFASYNITPPRGVLLCGPPGTGKTLIARALASAASKAGQKVSFYMRKGADVLSKWVGEAERQLKLLFEEAQRNQPSIIFFDEIDGLAPVRSSKQEQIHNSIVSTLLALMDGLDSRGQVVLIGATNRVDAIDGALRRPGRFDREFNFPLPGCDARVEILDIHTRKWKHPPSRELRLELAASCVGYCGADLKALCTEAAIQAFREKYPQVYTSDDKFVIDVNSVRVEKHHFMESMSKITPAAHRGSIVQARPLSLVVQSCLQRHLRKAMDLIADIFPSLGFSSNLTKLSIISYGSAIPLVYRPRLLLCGAEGAGLDHLGPAILHELEKHPVHSLGLASLLSDPSAKTPEEALVHIFSEARRTTPSILYIPQFNIWWDNAHDQLRAVLLTLLEELPSDAPILLLGTTSVPLSDINEDSQSVFPHRSVYLVDKPSTEDRSFFFDRLIEAALSVLSESMINKSGKQVPPPELPKAPKVVSGPKPSEIKAEVEAKQHALRRLRMCLRDVCNRVFYDKRFSVFHYPVSEEDAPDYRSIIQKPMDVATLLQNVDAGRYLTCSTFLQDVSLIVANAKVYNKDDYTGARIVSRAHELHDAVQGMLSQMDPALVAFCDKILAEGGLPDIPDDLEGSVLPSAPVVQLGTATRASARLRNIQPEANLDQRNEALKRPKKTVEATHAVEENTQNEDLMQKEASSSHEPEATDTIPLPSDIAVEICKESSGQGNISSSADATMEDGGIVTQMESVKELFMERTENHGIPQLERIYTRIFKGIFDSKDIGAIKDDPKLSILGFLLKFAEDEANF